MGESILPGKMGKNLIAGRRTAYLRRRKARDQGGGTRVISFRGSGDCSGEKQNYYARIGEQTRGKLIKVSLVLFQSVFLGPRLLFTEYNQPFTF